MKPILKTALIEGLESRGLFSAAPVVLLSTDFTQPVVSSALFHRPAFLDAGTFYGRTQQRTSDNEPLPATKGGQADLVVSSYNPTQVAGSPSFYGTELVTNKTFKVPKAGALEMVVRARLSRPDRGVITGGNWPFAASSTQLFWHCILYSANRFTDD